MCTGTGTRSYNCYWYSRRTELPGVFWRTKGLKDRQKDEIELVGDPADEGGRGQSERPYAPVRPPRAPPSPNGGYVRGWITFRSRKKSRS
jgi:hypothetical protein